MILKGKTAIITGGNSGIGLATSKLLSREGANVVIMGRSKDSLEVAAKEIGNGVITVQGDVRSLHDLERLYETTVERLGKVDILVANAGVAKFAPFPDFPESLFDEIVEVNFKGVFFTIQKALPHLNDGSSVILTGSSMATSRGAALNTAYLASKAAVRSLARSLTDELKGRRIRVNVISPGLTDTPILKRDIGEFSKYRDLLAEMYARMSPLQRLGKPEEIAQVILFLASPASGYIYGAEIVADAGMMQI